ncbi:MAG TPA: GNAT family protein [Edaphobacter sp.]|nr:GNAT family protein [Edaphobacter sp.]
MSLLQCDDILTSRLALIAITPETVWSEKAGDKRLGELIGCTIPKNWPHIDWEPHVFDFLLAQFDQHPDQIGWGRYVALPFSDGSRTLIGTVGAFTKSAAPYEAEIGYSLLPQFEGRGLATEAAKALVEFLRLDDRITSIIAHTFPSIPGSIRVMEKCGMSYDGEGEETGTIRYRMQLRPPK